MSLWIKAFLKWTFPIFPYYSSCNIQHTAISSLQDLRQPHRGLDLAETGSPTPSETTSGSPVPLFARAPGALLTKLTHSQSYRRFPGNHRKATSEHFIEYYAPDGD